MGLPDDAIRALETRKGPAEFGVWAENIESFTAFLTVQTQWRIVPQGDGKTYFHGLDYAGVAAGLQGAGIEATPALWSDIRLIERTARNRLNGIMETH